MDAEESVGVGVRVMLGCKAWTGLTQHFGAEEACWAHNPKVVGSRPTSANILFQGGPRQLTACLVARSMPDSMTRRRHALAGAVQAVASGSQTCYGHCLIVRFDGATHRVPRPVGSAQALKYASERQRGPNEGKTRTNGWFGRLSGAIGPTGREHCRIGLRGLGGPIELLSHRVWQQTWRK